MFKVFHHSILEAKLLQSFEVTVPFTYLLSAYWHITPPQNDTSMVGLIHSVYSFCNPDFFTGRGDWPRT